MIGLDAAGANILGNGDAGVSIVSAANNQVGGSSGVARNVISGNGNNGIVLIGIGTAGNVIQGNYIGTDQSGALARGNVQDGIFLQGVGNNQIGGTAAGAGNLISGNNANGNGSGNNGIYLTNSAQNVIQGNRIGTDVSGTQKSGQFVERNLHGICCQQCNWRLLAAGAGNLLSGNGRGRDSD